MSNFIGIRHEDKYLMERRAPLTPWHIDKLVKHKKLDFVVQSSDKRIFKDAEYIAAGAEVSDDLKKCSVIFGVKEMPVSFFEPEKTYVFFSHVIKGQPYNMPMLKRMVELGCNLIDYERVIDEQGKRLIFFGRYAGLAGMINTLWALGLRLKEQGFMTPFLEVKQACHYDSLDEARAVIMDVGQHIAEKGLPEGIRPLTFAFTGYGNVSGGAQEIMGLLPVKEISPEKLLHMQSRPHQPENLVYKVIFKERDLVQSLDPDIPFDLHDYYQHPENYQGVFERYAPHISVLVNCMYWDKRYPKLLTKSFLRDLFSQGIPKLIVVGDISCDVDGSVEATVHSTEIQDPIFVYNPLTERVIMGAQGEGLLDMAVDILPAELPRDSSQGFADVLQGFVKPIADADFELSFEDLDLPRAIKKALILHNGQFTPDYKYMEQYIAEPTLT